MTKRYGKKYVEYLLKHYPNKWLSLTAMRDILSDSPGNYHLPDIQGLRYILLGFDCVEFKKSGENNVYRVRSSDGHRD